MEIRSFVQAGIEVLTGGFVRERETCSNLKKKSNAVNYATDMFVKRDWIIIISVVLMVLDFAVSSLRWRYLQFGWRTVLCVSGIRCGSAWLHGSTVLQLSFKPVVIHLSAWIWKISGWDKCFYEVKMSWASFLLAPSILFYYLIYLFFPASSNEVLVQLLVWKSSFIIV